MGVMMLLLYVMASKDFREHKQYGFFIKWVCPILGIPFTIIDIMQVIINIIKFICL